jgi:endonuclease/exonuclease/phosphatase family metal-dependent hydrolase
MAALAAAGMAQADDGGKQWSGHRITVETRNLFVGFDAAALTFGAITPAQAWTDVLLSDPEGRAEAWADEIVRTRPDVVGLQEATLYQTGPLLDPAPAATVAFDFVALLVDALAERGLTYVPVATVKNLVAEVPVGPPFFLDVRLTDRDVLLVRDDRETGRLKVLGAQSGNYAAALPAGGLIFKRGWTSVDVELHGRTVRVVNTHLEAFHEGVRAAQASELLAGPGANPGPTILVGDFNSGPPAPTPTYALLTSQFDDVWPAVGGGAGLTCCHDDLTPAIPYDSRIDLVLAEDGIAPVSAAVIGDVPAASFPYFPSDHAGVVATVELP